MKTSNLVLIFALISNIFVYSNPTLNHDTYKIYYLFDQKYKSDPVVQAILHLDIEALAKLDFDPNTQISINYDAGYRSRDLSTNSCRCSYLGLVFGKLRCHLLSTDFKNFSCDLYKNYGEDLNHYYNTIKLIIEKGADKDIRCQLIHESATIREAALTFEHCPEPSLAKIADLFK